MEERFKLDIEPKALDENIISGDKFRITVLTSKLIRLEYSQEGYFEDRGTQSVFNRNFSKTTYKVKELKGRMIVETDNLRLSYDKNEFSSSGLNIKLIGKYSNDDSQWFYGDNTDNLKGTARTLDNINGSIELDNGLMSKRGYSILDDSNSLVILEDGFVAPRENKVIDIYFFGYGNDYKECLKDFYFLCGKTPMLPRYALGNWWSRFYKYSQYSYKELMDQFSKHNVPISIAVLDMDWHEVEIDSKYGSGWTGYSWNRALFPKPKEFLDWLHEQGMHITLNTHPAGGVGAHEVMYEDIAKELGYDTENEENVEFDISSPEFVEAYFKYLHHPNEENGVDFWWVDWQQGKHTRVLGLDPLWMLNHYHFMDNERNGKRGLILSRYCGIGSHRYPVGFSGDTHISWESLDFQPFFTANAANVGYGWWSHDIGGHMLGEKNDEMALRWLQFGVFSPIMRLHSSCSEFNGKEPWRYGKEVMKIMEAFLRLRHKFVPYLYTMSYRNYNEGIPLCTPIYYEYPNGWDQYFFKNQYFFGSEFMIAPITTPVIDKINLGKVKVWLPDGIFHDLFTGVIYSGNRTINMYRSIESIPVLAKAGAIVPVLKDYDINNNPETLVIYTFTGANGEFTLYEDDNVSTDYKLDNCVKTTMEFRYFNEQVFFIKKAQGNLSLIPEKRNYKIIVCGIDNLKVKALSDGEGREVTSKYDSDKHRLTIDVQQQSVKEDLLILFDDDISVFDFDYKNLVFDFLNKANIDFVLKDKIFNSLEKNSDPSVAINEIMTFTDNLELICAITELVTAYRE